MYEVRGILILECPVCGRKTWCEEGDDIPSHEHEWDLVGPVWFSHVSTDDPL
jgi:hypothetical protein